MNNEDNIIEARGLNRNSNDILLPPGSLIAADEAVIVKDNVISRRRGFKLCNSGLPAFKPEQLFASGGTLYVHENNALYWKNSNCVYSRVSGVTPLFNKPTYLWLTSANIFIADSLNFTIRGLELATTKTLTLAGLAGSSGSADGVGSAARFNLPKGIWGNSTDLYICDSANFTIRKIVISTATVSTFAGTAGASGSADGVGAAARFNFPDGIWGNATDLYICDQDNSTIRKIDIATATVSTFAGTAGITGNTDGIGAAARFDHPAGIWGNATHLYVADSNNNTIRKIEIATANVTTLATGVFTGLGIWGNATHLYVSELGNRVRRVDIGTGAVTTFAGSGTIGNLDGVGTNATFDFPYGVIGNSTDLYVANNQSSTIRKIVISTATVTTYAGTPYVTGSSDGYVLFPLFGPT